MDLLARESNIAMGNPLRVEGLLGNQQPIDTNGGFSSAMIENWKV